MNKKIIFSIVGITVVLGGCLLLTGCGAKQDLTYTEAATMLSGQQLKAEEYETVLSSWCKSESTYKEMVGKSPTDWTGLNTQKEYEALCSRNTKKVEKAKSIKQSQLDILSEISKKEDEIEKDLGIKSISFKSDWSVVDFVDTVIDDSTNTKEDINKSVKEELKSDAKELIKKYQEKRKEIIKPLIESLEKGVLRDYKLKDFEREIVRINFNTNKTCKDSYYGKEYKIENPSYDLEKDIVSFNCYYWN